MKQKQVCITLDEAFIKHVDACARLQNRTRSSLLGQLIYDAAGYIPATGFDGNGTDENGKRK